LPGLLREATSKELPELLKKFDELPFVMDISSKGKPGEHIKYTFSKDSKQ